MPFMQLASRPFRSMSREKIDYATIPTVEWLLKHRHELLRDKKTMVKGRTPMTSFYRMYEHLVVGNTWGLRTEMEFFFGQRSWHVAALANPADDPDPRRQAILAVLPSYLVDAFNRLIQRGLARGGPAIITPQVEKAMKAKPVVLETEPGWASSVPKLEERLIIPDHTGKAPEMDVRSPRFLLMNIVVAEPHVLFV